MGMGVVPAPSIADTGEKRGEYLANFFQGFPKGRF